MFKFIHAADIHLDSPLLKLDAYEGAPAEEIRGATRRAFENLVRTAVEEAVAFVVIAGDLFDGEWKDYNSGLYLVSQMSRLREAGIPVAIVAGNHDAASTITRSLRLPENVHFFPSDRPDTLRLEQLGVVIHGRSFGTPAVKTDLAQSYPPATAGCFNIGVLHTCATGREGHEPYAPCSLETLQTKGYDYWALGHVHRREVLLDDPLVVFAGNPQGRHARETGPKGCFLVTVDDAGRPTLDFKPLDVVRWEAAIVDASGAGSAYEVIDRFRETLQAKLERAPNRLTVLRVRLAGETSVHDEILSDPERWAHEVRAAAVDEAGERVWIEKVLFRTRPPAGARAPDGAVGELLALIDELSAAPDVLSSLCSDLSDLSKKLPREFRESPETLRLDDPNRLKKMLAEAKPMLMRRLFQDRRTP